MTGLPPSLPPHHAPPAMFPPPPASRSMMGYPSYAAQSTPTSSAHSLHRYSTTSSSSQSYPIQPPPPSSYSPHLPHPHSSPLPHATFHPPDLNFRRPSPSSSSSMVYPPPPPPPGHSYHPGSLFSQPVEEPSQPIWVSQQPSTPSTPFEPNYTWTKPARGTKRPSETAVAEEVEASLALAGLGMATATLPPVQVKTERRGSAGKKTKKEDKKEAKEAKDTKEIKESKEARKSCSECRRLKAKCDRVFPCSNCRRRGCAVVCPDGDLSCMQGKRLVLASTEQLHERIAQLESALFQAHSKSSPTAHPLLAPEYLDGGFANLSPKVELGQSLLSSPNEQNPSLERSASNHESSVSTAVVTPHSNGQGKIPLESLLLAEDVVSIEKREDEWVGENGAPALIVGTARGPSPDVDTVGERHQVAERLRQILTVLPSREEAKRRADRFWVQSVWFQFILRRDEYESVYEPAVFAPTRSNPLSPHKLACVLMVMTLDTYFDLSSDSNDPIIADYWDAVQQCFDTRFGWAASVAGVQALALMTLFVGFGWKGARASNFYFLRQMTSAVQQLGLHKDPHPSLPEDERDFRRHVFHESFVIDCLLSINHGQRSAIPLEIIEAPYPSNALQLSIIKYEYMRRAKYHVLHIGSKADTNPATREEIQAVHDVVMEFDADTHPEIHCGVLTGAPMPPPSDKSMFLPNDLFVTTRSMCHYKSMLFLYRPSLRQLVARLRTSTTPPVVFDDFDMQTVRMTQKACHSITLVSKYFARTHPRIAARTWSTWVQTFSAAVSMAAVAIWCSPYMEPGFVDAAFAELNEECQMIQESGCERSQTIASILPAIQSLVTMRYPHLVGEPSAAVKINTEGEDMLFALLGGHVDYQRVHPSPLAILSATLPHQKLPPTSAIEPLGQVEYGNIALPLVEPIPTSVPYPEDFMYQVPSSDLGHMQNGGGHVAHGQGMGVVGADQQQEGVEMNPPQQEMSNAEMWNKLQTFYEPTVWWGTGGQGLANLNGAASY